MGWSADNPKPFPALVSGFTGDELKLFFIMEFHVHFGILYFSSCKAKSKGNRVIGVVAYFIGKIT